MKKILVGLLIVVVGCATVANWGEMTPLEKAEFQIDSIVRTANVAIEAAKIVIEDAEDLEEVQLKINAVADALHAMMGLIMDQVPAENDAAMIYAERAVIKLEIKLEDFTAANVPVSLESTLESLENVSEIYAIYNAGRVIAGVTP